MAVEIKERGAVGCAYYVAREEKLYFMEDMKFGDIETIDACECIVLSLAVQLTHAFAVKLYANPTVVLISTKADDAVMDKLDPERRSVGSVDGSRTPLRIPSCLISRSD